MAEILESEWTLDALKRREEERLKNERLSTATDVADMRLSSGDEASGDNWLAQAFRRRQEEQRAKEILNDARSRDLAQTAESKASPVDDWLVAGFRRHEEEQRHMAQVASAVDAVSSPGGGAALSISGAHNLVPAPDTGIAPQKEQASFLGRRILVGGLIVVGALISILALRTALFAPPKSPAPVGAPKTTKRKAIPSNGAATEAKKTPSATGADATPPIEAPLNLQKPSLAAPEGQQKPAAGASAVGQESKPEAASPVGTEGKLNAEPQTIGPGKSPETIEPGKDQNASEAKQPTAGKKTKAAKNKSSAGRHSSAGTNPFSAFLTRTTNSVRKFFGR